MHSPLPVLGRGEPERYDSPAQVAGDLNVSLLGALGRTNGVRGPLSLSDLIDPEAHYDAVADRIQLLAGQMPLKLLGVIGLGDDPLRFRLAANLAGRLAAGGRQVTIVEAELGGPVLRHDRSRREGLLDMLLYGCSFAAVGRESGIRGVKLVSAGSHPWSGEPIHGDEWERVLGSLRQHSDFTLVTTTTGLPAPILGMLARRLDSIVIAYALHWSGREAVRRSYLALWDMDAPILGLVTEGPHAALAGTVAMAGQGASSRGVDRESAAQASPAASAARVRAEGERGAPSSGSGATGTGAGGSAGPPKLGAQWARRLLGDSVAEMPPITEEVEVVIRQTSEVDAAAAALWEKEVDRLRSIIAAPDGVAPFVDSEPAPPPPMPEIAMSPPMPELTVSPIAEERAPVFPVFEERVRETPPAPLPEVLHREAGPAGAGAVSGEHIQITYEHPGAQAPLPEVLHREAGPAGGAALPGDHIQITYEPSAGPPPQSPVIPASDLGRDPIPDVLNREAVPPHAAPKPAEGKIDIVVDRMFGLAGGSAAGDATPPDTAERRTIPLATSGSAKPEKGPLAPPPFAEKQLGPLPDAAASDMSADAALDAAFDLTSEFMSDAKPFDLLSEVNEKPASAAESAPEETAIEPSEPLAEPRSPVFDLDSEMELGVSPPSIPSASPEVLANVDPEQAKAFPAMETHIEAAAPAAWNESEADLPWLRPEPEPASESTEGILESPLPRQSADHTQAKSPLAGLTRSELAPEVATGSSAAARPARAFAAAGPSVPTSISVKTVSEPQFPAPDLAADEAIALDQKVIEAIEEELVGAPAVARAPAPSPPVKSRTPWRVFILGSLVGLTAVLFWAYRSGAIRLEPRPPRQGTAAIEGTAPAIAEDATPADAIPAAEDPSASAVPHAAIEAPPLPASDLPTGDAPLASDIADGGAVPTETPAEPTGGSAETPPAEPVAPPPPAPARDVKVVGQAPRGYGVHVGSFRTTAVAEKDLARFTGSGYAGLLVEVAVPGKGMWQRVVLGPYPTLAAAEKVAAEVRAAGMSPKAQSMQLKP